MKTNKLAAAVAAVTKRVLGADVAQPAMVKMPKAAHEVHVSDTDVIPAGTLITDEIADLAGLTDEVIDDLVDRGAFVLVDVLAATVEELGTTGA